MNQEAFSIINKNTASKQCRNASISYVSNMFVHKVINISIDNSDLAHLEYLAMIADESFIIVNLFV